MLREGVGNPKVRKWIASVEDNALRLSLATLFEKRRGVEILPNPNTLGLRDAWSRLKRRSTLVYVGLPHEHLGVGYKFDREEHFGGNRTHSTAVS